MQRRIILLALPLLLGNCHGTTTAVAPERVQVKAQNPQNPMQQAGAAEPSAAIAAFMKVHNDARAEVGVPPLLWSDPLAAFAQEWADHLASSGTFEHRPDDQYGENLAGFSPPDGPDSGARLWLSEKNVYHGEKMTGDNYQQFGHYTQMIWRKSLRVGYGMAKMPDGTWVLVAEYDPAGNMQDEHPYQ
jgi:pathogenesis-related protein 1